MDLILCRAEACWLPSGAIENSIMNTICVCSFPLSQLLFPASSIPSYSTCRITTSLFLTTADQPGFVVCTLPTSGAAKQPYLNSHLNTPSLCLVQRCHTRLADQLPPVQTSSSRLAAAPGQPFPVLLRHVSYKDALPFLLPPQAPTTDTSHTRSKGPAYSSWLIGDLSFAYSLETMESDLQSIFPAFHLTILQVPIWPS